MQVLLTGVILLTFLASTVTCRPRGNSNSNSSSTSSRSGSNNNYLKGQQYQHQAQRYDHHYAHRLSSNSNAYNHHNNHHSSDNYQPHYHSKRGYYHHEYQQHHRQQQDEKLERDAEVDESNQISLLHNANTHSQQRPHPASSSLAGQPLSSGKTKSARATKTSTSAIKISSRRRPVEEDYEDYDDDEDDDDDTSSGGGGRHAYLMTTDKKKTSKEKITEDEALSQAFEKHMRPSSSVKINPKEEVHDVYAYQLPSDLWFVVRYNKNADGQVEKYM